MFSLKPRIAHVAVLGLMLTAGACRSPVYEGTESANTATLTFTSRGIAAQPFLCVPGRGFLPTRGRLSARQQDDGEKPPVVRVRLAAGREQTVGVRHERPDGSSCRVSARFTPAAGIHYRARFLVPGGQCALAVLNNRNQAVSQDGGDQWACP